MCKIFNKEGLDMKNTNNNTNSKNRTSSCTGKMETSQAKNYKQSEEKSKNSSNFKSSMENSDY